MRRVGESAAVRVHWRMGWLVAQALRRRSRGLAPLRAPANGAAAPAPPLRGRWRRRRHVKEPWRPPSLSTVGLALSVSPCLESLDVTTLCSEPGWRAGQRRPPSACQRSRRLGGQGGPTCCRTELDRVSHTIGQRRSSSLLSCSPARQGPRHQSATLAAVPPAVLAVPHRRPDLLTSFFSLTLSAADPVPLCVPGRWGCRRCRGCRGCPPTFQWLVVARRVLHRRASSVVFARNASQRVSGAARPPSAFWLQSAQSRDDKASSACSPRYLLACRSR